MIRKNIHFSLLFSLFLILSACGGAASTSSASDESSEESGAAAQVNTEASVEGVTEFSIPASGSLSLENLKSDSSYLLAVYNSQTTTAATSAWSAGDESLPQTLTKAAFKDVTEDIHETLRANEEALEPTEISVAPAMKRAVKALEVGSSRSFKVLSSLSGTGSTTTVSASLAYADSKIYVYVDDRNAEALSETEINEVMASFSDKIDEEQGLFGSESDVNGDTHFVVLLTQAVNELGASGGGFLTGYFYALDLYPDETYAASNEMEILYTMVPDPTGEFGVQVSKEFTLSNILPSVLPHEFQHMINYNQHVLVRSGSAEASFLNEALSHLAEDIYSVNASGYMEETGIENPSRVGIYLESTSSVCFTCGSSLAQRGGSYLFIRYLYEQAEKGNLAGASTGAALIASLLETSNTGVANIVNAALASASTADFSTLLSRFSMALYLSGSASVSDSRYTFSGINLWATQDDNRGTELSGPAVTTNTGSSVSALVASSGVSFVKLSGEEIVNGTLSLQFGSGLQGGGFLVEIR